jgi:hypothetical protein
MAGDTRGSEGARVSLQEECDIHAGIDGFGSQKPSAVCRVSTTLPGKKRGSDTSSINFEFAVGANTILRGGGSGDSFIKLNGQWTSTADSSTQGCNTIFH